MKVRDILSEFKAFLLRGNVVDLAVAVVVGTAFTRARDGAGGGPRDADHRRDLRQARLLGPHFTINGSVFRYGSFLNALITFVSVAAAVFFFVVVPVNALMRRRKTEPDVSSETHPCTRMPERDPEARAPVRVLRLAAGTRARTGLGSAGPRRKHRHTHGPRLACRRVAVRERRAHLGRQLRRRPGAQHALVHVALGREHDRAAARVLPVVRVLAGVGAAGAQHGVGAARALPRPRAGRGRRTRPAAGPCRRGP